MYKRWISLVLAAILLLSLAGCTDGIPAADYTVETDPVITESPTEETPATDEMPQPTVPDRETEEPDEPQGPGPAVLPTEDEDVDPAKPTDPTKPTEAPEQTDSPTEAPTQGGSDKPLTEFERYNNMSGDEQKDFIDSFDSIEDFFAWYNKAKAEYEALHPDIDVGDGNVDLGGN